MPPSKKSLLVLGIMSGTSIDGTDFALCQLSRHRIRLEHFWQVQFPRALQKKLQQAAHGDLSCHAAAQLHHDLGRFYALAARQGLGDFTPDLAGLHGQTVFHQPGPRPASWQIGEPAYLAQQLRIPVVSNFRAADIAAGGQGAPLATLFHCHVFAQPDQHVCVHNLGGISNVTSIDSRHSAQPRILAFDTGPANMPLDLAIHCLSQGQLAIDPKGNWAKRGQVCQPVLRQLLQHRFLSRKPPKSTGRELFGETFVQDAIKKLLSFNASKFDTLATLTEFTVQSILLNYKLHLPALPNSIVFAGGGIRNDFLMTRLRNAFDPSVKILSCSDLNWPAQSVEPAAFALLAYRRFFNLPGNIPATTGARHAVPLGTISDPRLPRSSPRADITPPSIRRGGSAPANPE